MLRQDSTRSSWPKKVLGLLASTSPSGDFTLRGCHLVWYQPQRFFKGPCQMFEDIDKFEVIVDELLVWGKNTEDHDHTLKQVLKRAAAYDFRLSEQKCKFHRQEVEYGGHAFGTDGLRPNPDRIQAILNMPVPQDKTGLQRIMGMENYLHKFVPNLAISNKPLHELQEKSAEWHWMGAQEKAYETLIPSITQAPVLTYLM